MDNDNANKSLLERCLEPLIAEGVEFLVVGGQAEGLLGSARVTFDVDVCYRRSTENIERLARALVAMNPTLRGAPKDLPYRFDVKALTQGSNFTLDTNQGPFDLLGYLEPIGDYDSAVRTAVDVVMGSWTLKVLSLDDLIRIKEHIGRPKDRDSLMHLLAIRRVRDE